jgi:hypothetical protein
MVVGGYLGMGSFPAVMTLINRNTTIIPGDDLGVIQFVGKDDSSGGYASSQIRGSVYTTAGTGAGGGGILSFWTAGAGSGATMDERMVINQTGAVGINTTTPAYKLDVNGSFRVVGDTDLGGDIFIGGTGVMSYYSSMFTLGDWDGNDINTRILGGNGNMVFQTYGDNVGIGTTTAAYKLDVSGTIRATGDVIAYSDIRVKENIKTLDNSLEKVVKLRGVEFNKIGENIKSIGVIAQEIETILPEVVRTDDRGMKSVAYGNISGLLIEAIKDLKVEIDLLKHKIDILESK